MDITEKIIEAIGGDIWQSGLVASAKLIISDEVRESCEKNYCGCYGKCWTCPPGVGGLDEMKQKLLKFSNVFVFTTKHELEDCFDYEGMQAAHRLHDEITEKIKPLCREYGALVLGAGRCNICRECTYPDSPCRFPDKATVSLEACGINVVELSKTAGINYINGKDTVTYFTAVLFN